MLIRKTTLQNVAALAFLVLFCIGVRSDMAIHGSSRMAHLPRRTFWAWERPEDLRGINPADTAIAYLDQTLLINGEVESQPLVQPLAYPTGTILIPVVRLEATANAKLDPDAERQVVHFLLRSAKRSGISALQIDFDATRSQRAFYRDVLRQLRQQMPADLPLSMTGLASWCSYDDWIGTLPVDEAVPMFFRMEPDRRRSWADQPAFQVREPLCMDSVGLSTREPWPQNIGNKRVYVFADRGWQSDLAFLAQRKLP